MAVIQFDNGTKVNFNGNPTPQDVEEAAKSLGISNTTSPQIPQQSTGVGGLKGASVGAFKGLGSTIAGATQLGEKGLAAATRGIGSLIGSKNLQSTQADTIPQDIKQKYLTPQGTAEKIGFGAEQVAEFFAPVPGGAKAKLLLKATEKAPALLKVAKFAGRAGLDIAEAVGKGTLQQGTLDKVPQEAAGQAAFSALFGLISPVAKAGAQVLGKTTGAGGTAITEAFNNPSVRKFISEARSKGPEFLQEQALSEAKDALASFTKKAGDSYRKQLEQIATAKGSLGEIKDNAVNLTQEALGNASVKISKKGKLGINAFRDSAVEQGKSQVQKAYRILSTWRDTTPAGLDTLKKKLNIFKNAVKHTTDGSYSIIKTMSESISDGLKSNVPDYQQMTAGYHAAMNVQDEMQRALSLGGSAAKETAIKKLMGSLRDNNEVRLALLEKLQGKRDIVGKLAGAQLAPTAPKGIAGTLSGIGGGIGGATFLLHPETWPLMVTLLASASPALVGHAVSLLGSLSRGIPAEQVILGLRGLLSQAFPDSQSGTPNTP